MLTERSFEILRSKMLTLKVILMILTFIDTLHDIILNIKHKKYIKRAKKNAMEQM